MEPVILETPRLILRRWTQADFAPFVQMNADPEVMRYFPNTLTAGETRDFYRRIQAEFADSGYGLCAAQEKAHGAFIGFIGFHQADFEASFTPCIEIGWRLDKRFWNRGFATEGAKACLVYGFESLGFDRVYSFTAEINRPSQRVMQKIGLAEYLHFNHPRVAAGSPLCAHVCYMANREKYLKNGEAGA